MKTSTLIGMGSYLFRKKKIKLLMVGAQFALAAFKYLKKKKKKIKK